MIQNSELLLHLWLGVKAYIPKKEVEEAAISYVRQAEEFIDIEAAMIEIKGEDRALDAAFKELYPDDTRSDHDDDTSDDSDSDSEYGDEYD